MIECLVKECNSNANGESIRGIASMCVCHGFSLPSM